MGLTTDLVLSSDSRYLFASYPGASGVFVFDVDEIDKTIKQYENDPNNVLAKKPLDELNPNISIAATLKPASSSGALEDSRRSPIGLGNNPYGMARASNRKWVRVESIAQQPPTSPGAKTTDLTPTVTWNFDQPIEDIREVNLFVSTFEAGKGLLPWDQLVDLSNSDLLPGLSEEEKRNRLSKRWQGYDDFNPGRIVTATWNRQTNTWVGYDGSTVFAQPTIDPQNNQFRFTLPNDRQLTAGQDYYIGVQAINVRGEKSIDVRKFQTIAPLATTPFSSVTVLTHGFTLLPGIPQDFFTIADSITEAGGDSPAEKGLILKYDKPSGEWIPVNQKGQVLKDLTGGLDPRNPAYRSTLASKLLSTYQHKSLVLLPEWSVGGESNYPTSGFTEAAADALFASIVQLDQALGGQALINSNGRFERNQGALLDSPLHFIGFSRGTVVNSEIIQRLGTFFPHAGGVVRDAAGKVIKGDLQMTTIDPHDFYQPSLPLPFSDFQEPKVQVWENVTFADNYYQTVANTGISPLITTTLTPNGRDLYSLPTAETSKQPLPAGLNFPRNASGQILGQPDVSVLLNGRTGFTSDNFIGGPHGRTLAWYGGTADLALEQVQNGRYFAAQDTLFGAVANLLNKDRPEPIYDQLGEQDIVNLVLPPVERRGITVPLEPLNQLTPWYTQHGSAEGIGTGWYYSVLGGGRSWSSANRP